MEETRPDPEQFLKQLKKEEHVIEQDKQGKLKIFLGFAAGVGKTYAMLKEAHSKKEQGIDVVAGYIEPHERTDTMNMQEGLEQIPPLLVDYKGIRLKELDLDACLERRPQILLVDELAHTNAEGCRHQKRYQDIEEILKAGVSVYTTVNIQHLESLNDLVASITKIKVRERIPDSIFDEADQVEVVDIEPADLISRLKEGKIYRENQASRAIDNFFAKEKLIALREIALRRMADRVTLLAEEETPAGKREYYVGEHILTCVSPSPTNAKVIRTAARLAHAFHGELTALCIETPLLQNADPKVKRMMEENLQLARDLGAKISTVFGEDVSYQIAEYAKVSNISKVVIGRTTHKRYLGMPKGTVVDRLTEYAPKLDIYIIPDSQPDVEIKRRHTNFAMAKPTGADVLKTVGLLVGSTLVGELFRYFELADSNIIMVYILGVLLCSMYTNGRVCSLIASVVSVLMYNFFFTMPFFSLRAYDKGYPLTFLVMFLVAFLVSSLTVKLRKQNRESAKMAYRTELLLVNIRKLQRTGSVDETVKELVSQIMKLMNLPVLVYLKQNGKILGPRLFPRKGMEIEDMKEYITTTDRTAAEWVFHNHHRAGVCTSTLPAAKAIYLPVQDNEEVLAVVGIVLEERREIPPFEYGLLSAMLNEASTVLERYLHKRPEENKDAEK